MKTCTYCKETKVEGEFSKCTRLPDGLQYWCKLCMAKNKNENYYKDIGKTRKKGREGNKALRKKFPERFREYDRKSYEKNREKKLEWGRKYRLENRFEINRKQIVKSRKNGVLPKRGYVYVMKFPEIIRGNECYKIGQSYSPEYRRLRLSTESPLPLDIIILIETDDMSLLESELQHIFHHKNSNAEWFFLLEEDIEYIIKNYPCNTGPF